MKAAVLHNFGETPHYEDFPDPIPGKDEVLVQVKAVVLENVNKMMAEGVHYSSKQFFPKFPAIIGHGGVGMTKEGNLVGFRIMNPPYGAFAQKAVIPKSLLIPVPDGVDPALAAALPSSALTSLLPLKYTAKLQEGETVLINGATGVTGKIAIQVAKMLGAGRVIGTGRNDKILKSLGSLGADAVINLQQPDEKLIEVFSQEAGATGCNVVIDFIWGHPAEILMRSFVPKELGFAKRRIRYIHIGQKAGSTISLSGEMLRTSGLEIYGAGNIPPEAIDEGMAQVWKWVKEKKIQMDIEKVSLADIEKAWNRQDLDGKRLVVIP